MCSSLSYASGAITVPEVKRMEVQLISKIETINTRMPGMKAKLQPREMRDYHIDLTIAAELEQVVYTETENYKVCVAGWSETHYDDDIEGCFLNNTQFRLTVYSQRKDGKEIREQELKRILTNSFVGHRDRIDLDSRYRRLKILPGQDDVVKIALVSEECLEDFLAGPTFEMRLE